MKPMLYISLFLFMVSGLCAQQSSDPKDAQIPSHRFHAGLSYSFLSNDMKLCDMKLQSIWSQDDYGVYTLDQDEIDQVNETTTFNKSYQGIGLQVGYEILRNPSSRWHIDGTLIFGLMKTTYKTRNKNYDSLKFDLSSDMNNPAVGMAFRFDYRVKGPWGVSLAPYLVYSWGKPEGINDQTTAKIEFLNATSTYSFDYFYSRLTPMVFYDFKKVRVSAGPGFYYLYYSTKYHLERTNPITGAVYQDNSNATLRSKSFIDADFRVIWKIMDRLVLNVSAAYGGDFIAHTAISWSF